MQGLIWFQRDRTRHTDRGLDISEEFVTFNRVTKSSRWCVWTNYPSQMAYNYRGGITNRQQKMKTKNNAVLRDRSREEEEFNRGHLVYRIQVI